MEPIDWAAIQVAGPAVPAAAPAPAPAPAPLPKGSVDPEWFFTCAEMIWAHLRTKESDRWSSSVALIQHRTFVHDFPEVSTKQFIWATNQWIQSTAGKEFIRFPAWRELMAPLYCVDKKGLAVRSWGMRPELPPRLQPTPEQLALMPPRWPVGLDPQAVIAARPDGLPMLASTGPRQPLPLPGKEPPLLPPSNDQP